MGVGGRAHFCSSETSVCFFKSPAASYSFCQWLDVSRKLKLSCRFVGNAPSEGHGADTKRYLKGENRASPRVIEGIIKCASNDRMSSCSGVNSQRRQRLVRWKWSKIRALFSHRFRDPIMVKWFSCVCVWPRRSGAPVGATTGAPVPPGKAPLSRPPQSGAEQQGRQMGGGSGYSCCCCWAEVRKHMATAAAPHVHSLSLSHTHPEIHRI